MSSPHTAAFLAAWRQLAPGGPGVDPTLDPLRFWLAKIELTTPTPLTLRFGSHEAHTPDGSSWQIGLGVQSIRQGVDYLGPGVTPAAATIRIAKRPVIEAGTGQTISDLLHLYLFPNAVVTIYKWTTLLNGLTVAGCSTTNTLSAVTRSSGDWNNDVRPGTGIAVAALFPAGTVVVSITSPTVVVVSNPANATTAAGSQVAALAPWGQAFRGVITRPGKVDPEGVTFEMLQDQSWNVQLPRVIDKTTDPDAPDVSQGLVRGGILYGDFAAPKMRTPWTTAFGDKSKQEDAGAGQGAVPLVLVDAGTGTAPVKVVAADHAVADILDRSSGHSAFMAGDNLLNPLDTTGITETLGGSEAFLSIADETTIAYAAVIPIDVRVNAGAGNINTALNPRRAMDPRDETSFASIDQGAAQGVLQLIMPSLGSLGHIELVQASIAYIGDPGNTHQMRVNGFTPGTGAGGFAPAAWNALGTTPVVQVVTWPVNYYSQNWDFGGGTGQAIWDLRVDFVGGAANKAKIIWAVLVVKYRPNRSVVTPGAIVITGKNPNFGPFTRLGGFPRPTTGTIAPTWQLEGQFFGHPKGYKDDGSGTFTGAANALIERPCDIARHFLVTYGNVSASDIETAATATGSFVLARSALRNASPTDLKLAARVGDRTTTQRVLQKLGEQGGMCIYQDRLSNKWLCFAWRRGATVDYDRVLSRDAGDFASFEADESTVVELRHAIRVKYFFDHFRSRALFEAFLNKDGSGQGLGLPTIRDQRLVVDGTNDQVNWIQVAVGTFAVTMAHATYAPIDLAASLRAGMRVVLGTNNMDVGWGFSIASSHNHKIDFDVAAVNYVATLTAGDYTAEGLAAEVIRAVNVAAAAAAIAFRLTAGNYDHPTNTFSFTGSAAFSFDGTSAAANYATSAVHVLGDYNHAAAATTWGSTVARYGDRFWFGSVGLFNMLWGTGAGAATNAANLLGYDKIDSGSTRDNPGTYSRGDRERKAATDQAFYGPHEELALDGDWIRDENTAVQLRNRRWDLGEKPAPETRYTSWRVPDMRPMTVFGVSGDRDATVPFTRYGSDGSWAGKTMLALEVVDFPDFHTEVLAVEVPSTA